MKENLGEKLNEPLSIPDSTPEDIAADRIGYYEPPTDRLADLPLQPKFGDVDKSEPLKIDVDEFEKEPAVGGSYVDKMKASMEKYKLEKAKAQNVSTDANPAIAEEINYVDHLTQEALDKRE